MDEIFGEDFSCLNESYPLVMDQDKSISYKMVLKKVTGRVNGN